MTYITQGRSRNHDMSNIQCFPRKRFGYYASNCPRKLCNYCKNDGHIIKECPTRPPKGNATTFTTSVDSSTVVQQRAPIVVQQNAPTVVQQTAPTAV